MAVGPDPDASMAAVDAAAGEGQWVHDGLALVGWCVYVAPVGSLLQGLVEVPRRCYGGRVEGAWWVKEEEK